VGLTALTITSPAFADGDTIPDAYTCRGANISPPLVIADVPVGTHSLALIMHDPDAPSGDFLHWSLWNINPSFTSLPTGEVPDEAVHGTNSFGTLEYGGPCPGSGEHHYVFALYALDIQAHAFFAVPTKQNIVDMMQGHILAQAKLIGVYRRK